jgi:hypothetical protein
MAPDGLPCASELVRVLHGLPDSEREGSPFVVKSSPCLSNRAAQRAQQREHSLVDTASQEAQLGKASQERRVLVVLLRQTEILTV